MRQLIWDEMQKLSVLLIKMQNDDGFLAKIEAVAKVCLHAIQQKRKIFFVGNGGSAADAQHLASELVGRLRYSRPGLPAIALTTDTSAMTAISNDFGYERIFARQVEALGQEGDILIGISTSGKSPNILRAFEAARAMNIITIGFTGQQAPLLDACCDFVLKVPSHETQKIQECHIMLGHIICTYIEDTLFGAEYDPQLKQHTAS